MKKTIIWSVATICLAAVMAMGQAIPPRPPSHITTNLDINVRSADHALVADIAMRALVTNTVTVNGSTQSVSNNPVFSITPASIGAEVAGSAAAVAGISNSVTIWTNGVIKSSWGTNLYAAIAASVAGNTIVLGAGTYYLPSSIQAPDGIIISGAGKQSTVISNQSTSVLSLGSNCKAQNMTFYNWYRTGLDVSKGMSASTNVVVDSCMITGAFDGLTMSQHSSATFNYCDFWSLYDTIRLDAAYPTFNHCNIISDASHSTPITGGGTRANGCRADNPCVINFNFCNITTFGSSTENEGIYLDLGAVCTSVFCNVSTIGIGGGDFDASDSTSTNVEIGCNYKTSTGTLLHGTFNGTLNGNATTATTAGTVTGAQSNTILTALQPNGVSGTDPVGTIAANGLVTTVGSSTPWTGLGYVTQTVTNGLLAANGNGSALTGITSSQVAGVLTNVVVNNVTGTVANAVATLTVSAGAAGTWNAQVWGTNGNLSSAATNCDFAMQLYTNWTPTITMNPGQKFNVFATYPSNVATVITWPSGLLSQSAFSQTYTNSDQHADVWTFTCFYTNLANTVSATSVWYRAGNSSVKTPVTGTYTIMDSTGKLYSVSIIQGVIYTP